MTERYRGAGAWVFVLVTLVASILVGLGAPSSAHSASRAAGEGATGPSDGKAPLPLANARPGTKAQTFAVSSTLVLANNTLTSGNFFAANGVGPLEASYDSGKREIFVTNFVSGNVTVIRDATNAAVATIDVGSEPYGIAYDSVRGEVFVANSNSSDVSVINDTTNTVVATVAVGSVPSGVAYDSGRAEIFVANYGSNTVSVISDTTNTVTATIAVGSGPWGVAYDSGKAEVFVANDGSGTVSVISDATNSVIGSVSVGTNPYDAAYDGGKGEVFVANYGSDTVSVISDITDMVIASISVGGDPYGVAYDPAKGEVFISNNLPGTLSVIDDATNSVGGTIVVGNGPLGLAYDGGKGEIFVANYDSNTVAAVSDTTGAVVATVLVGSEPVAMAYDSALGEIFVTDIASNSVSVISDVTNRVVATIPVGYDPVGITYDSGKGEMFVANYDSGSVSVISDATNSVVATISLGLGPNDVAYDGAMGEVFVTASYYYYGYIFVISDATNSLTYSTPIGIDPTGLAYDGATGQLFVADHYTGMVYTIWGSNNSVGTGITVGSGPLDVAYDSGLGEIFVTNTVSDTVSVISDVNDSVVATIPVGTDPFGIRYAGALGEVFVADQLADNVSVINDTTNTVVATVAVGGFPVDVEYAAATGSAYVANYGQGTISVMTAGNPPGVYTVTFSEAGLPTGTSWSVTLGGTTYGSTKSTVAFAVGNGTYGFSVAGAAGYAWSPSTGTLIVSGAGVTQTIVFTPAPSTYVVTFTESGLASGSGWTVTLGGTAQTSHASTMSFGEGNGTYPYAITPIAGYQTAWSGSVTVSGGSAQVAVVWTEVTYTVTFAETGLPSGSWGVTFAETTSRATVGNAIDFVGVPNGTYAYNVSGVAGYTADHWSGTVVVSGPPGNPTVRVTFARTTYTVTFAETGLPSGGVWAVTFDGITHQAATGTTVGVSGVTNGTYGYNVSAFAGYTAAVGRGTVTVSKTPANPTVTVAFTPVRYTVTFTETGLPTGSWGVTLGSTTESSSAGSPITFEVPNGSYDYNVSNVAGWRATAYVGSVTVDGGPTSVAVAWTQATYTVTFTETGLMGAEWAVTLGGNTSARTAGSTIAFQLPNGTYSYNVSNVAGWRAGLYASTVTVLGGASSVTVVWAAVTYTVTFTESGLPSGTSWAVTLGGSSHNSTASTITFAEPNGTYSFTMGLVSGYGASPASGSVKVSGAAVHATTAWTRVEYSVTITETGLAGGTSWSVTVGTAAQGSTTSTIVFHEPNGTYSYSVGVPSGYTANASSGTFAVQGGGVSLVIAFASPASTILGLAPVVFGAVVGSAAVVVAVAAAFIVLRARRKR